MYAAKSTEYYLSLNEKIPSGSIEKHVCPYCYSLNLKEHVEPVLAESIVSVKSVELDKVDEMILQGYEVKELYAKTATMIKKTKEIEVKKNED
jgi:hypothetical protein